MELWMCGQYHGPGEGWDFQGIFSSKENAAKACRDSAYFICLVGLDAEAPHETVEFPNIEFPLAESS